VTDYGIKCPNGDVLIEPTGRPFQSADDAARYLVGFAFHGGCPMCAATRELHVVVVGDFLYREWEPVQPQPDMDS
jgi:hypothetical protein